MSDHDDSARSLFVSVTGEAQITESQRETGASASRVVDDEQRPVFRADDGLDSTYPDIEIEHD